MGTELCRPPPLPGKARR
ncbi:hypothetical protein CIB84_009844 [Bambusicola thoracicus]|uniref:Uncharacterized protein n=1 Tax=Bambusicola thoracicus TaxID=9083 RepID=A0A2P4SQM0_BAMTH|nr:hypothetical protein CIB84_009844 [Bambusicola thoracicus]